MNYFFSEQINVGDIGSLIKIRLHHDNSNDFPSLHLDKVVMTDQHTNEELIFYCDRWMATDEADCVLIREFPAVRSGQPALPGKYSQVLRKIEASALNVEECSQP